MTELYKTLFMDIFLINDYRWFVIYNILIIPMFVLGLRKKYWMMPRYRQLVLISFFIFIALNIVGVLSILKPAS